MSIPQFNQRGKLPKGIHLSTPEEFLDRFCNPNETYKNTIRESYIQIVEEIITHSKRFGAKSIIFGGSFITDSKYPNDLDCIVIVPNQKCIPEKGSYLHISDCTLDIMYIAEENKESIYNMINLFSTDKMELEVGIVEVDFELNDVSRWSNFEEHKSCESLIVARALYEGHQVINKNDSKGVIISIHGFNTDADWNSEIAPIISSRNWTFAPFIYGNVKLPLIDSKSTMVIMNEFREWISIINSKYGDRPNVVAHSFGTYILGKYLEEFNFNPPINFGNILLVGSILKTDFDWNRALESKSVLSIFNVMSKNDQWVSKIILPKFIKDENLYGTAGINGFTQTHSKLIQESIDIFDHSSMLKCDFFEHKLMTYFEIANRYRAKDK